MFYSFLFSRSFLIFFASFFYFANVYFIFFFFFFSSRRRHTRSDRDWSSDVCSSDLGRERFHVADAFDLNGNVLLSYRRDFDRNNFAAAAAACATWRCSSVAEKSPKHDQQHHQHHDADDLNDAGARFTGTLHFGSLDAGGIVDTRAGGVSADGSIRNFRWDVFLHRDLLGPPSEMSAMDDRGLNDN